MYYTDLYCSSLLLNIAHENKDNIEMVVLSGAAHSKNIKNILECLGFTEFKHDLKLDIEKQLLYK